jgi:hypothetical protein
MMMLMVLTLSTMVAGLFRVVRVDPGGQTEGKGEE